MYTRLRLLLGGVLTEYFSWGWTLHVNLGFAVIAIAGALVFIHGSQPAVRPRMDWPGTVLASAGLFLIVFGFSHAETGGWTAALTLGSLVLGVLLLAGFVLAERRVSHPLLPLHMLLDRTRGGAHVAVGLAGISIFGVFLFLTYCLQVVKGYSPLTCGLLFLPFVGCILLSSNVSSIVPLPRFGPRVLIASGMLPAMLIMGLGFGMIFAPTINTATADVRRADSGVASALVNRPGSRRGGSLASPRQRRRDVSAHALPRRQDEAA
jgi:hypothetical protein